MFLRSIDEAQLSRSLSISRIATVGEPDEVSENEAADFFFEMQCLVQRDTRLLVPLSRQFVNEDVSSTRGPLPRAGVLSACVSVVNSVCELVSMPLCQGINLLRLLLSKRPLGAESDSQLRRFRLCVDAVVRLRESSTLWLSL